MVDIIKWYGSAGTGKTARMLREVEDIVAGGISPSQIAYLAFTKPAAYEARDRILAKGYDPDDDCHGFRTIHSLCFRLLGLNPREEPMFRKKKHFAELEQITSVQFAKKDITDPHDIERYDIEGNRILNYYKIARNRCIPNPDKAGSLCLLPGGAPADVSSKQYDFVIEKYKGYKNEKGLHDFDDLLIQCYQQNRHFPYNVLFLDEAQDCTLLQWTLIDKWLENCKWGFLGGDDAQAIYGFSGAEARHFLDHPGDELFLTTSYRLPRAILEYSKKIFERIKERRDRPFETANENEGIVDFIYSTQYQDYIPGIIQEGSTFILHRHRFGCENIARELVNKAVPFRNPRGYDPLGYKAAKAFYALESLRLAGQVDREYLLALAQSIPSIIGGNYKYMTRGAKTALKESHEITFYSSNLEALGFTQEFFSILKAERYSELIGDLDSTLLKFYRVCHSKYNFDRFFKPDIRISTIHGVKGQEADNNIVCNELSRRAYRAYQFISPDDEHRCFYTGVTRAKKRLVLLNKIAQYNYRF